MVLLRAPQEASKRAVVATARRRKVMDNPEAKALAAKPTVRARMLQSAVFPLSGRPRSPTSAPREPMRTIARIGLVCCLAFAIGCSERGRGGAPLDSGSRSEPDASRAEIDASRTPLDAWVMPPDAFVRSDGGSDASRVDAFVRPDAA